MNLDKKNNLIESLLIATKAYLIIFLGLLAVLWILFMILLILRFESMGHGGPIVIYGVISGSAIYIFCVFVFGIIFVIISTLLGILRKKIFFLWWIPIPVSLFISILIGILPSIDMISSLICLVASIAFSVYWICFIYSDRVEKWIHRIFRKKKDDARDGSVK